MVKFLTPTLIVRNISNKAVRVFNNLVLDPGDETDVFTAVNPQKDITEKDILRLLARPYGDLYQEVVIKKSLRIISFDLPSFHYGKNTPENIIANNSPSEGSFLGYIDGEFEWLSSLGFVSANQPLIFDGNTISIPVTNALQDGYLAKKDWLRFNASVKGDLRIWQYQDFSAPVGSSVTISSFENGTGLTFDSSYIIDSSAEAVLVSDTSRPPTTTTAFPARLLPGNRVSVSSHIGTTVVFNNIPDNSQNVRVFCLISLPATVKLPNDYQEDPEFLNDSNLEYSDDLYLNRNEDEDIYGTKTFEGDVVINSGLQITTGAQDGYYLRSDASGNA